MGETANIGTIVVITVAALILGGLGAYPFVGAYMQSRNKGGGTRHKKFSNNSTRRK